MANLTTEDVQDLMERHFAAYPNASISKDMVDYWYSALTDYPVDKINLAMRLCVEESVNYPFSLGMVLQHLKTIYGESKQSLERAGAQAFLEVMKTLKSYTYNVDLFFSDPRAFYATKYGMTSLDAWMTSRLSDEQLQKRFIEAYVNAAVGDGQPLFIACKDHEDSLQSRARIAFIGDYYKCLSLSDAVYHGRHCAVPADPKALKLENSLNKVIEKKGEYLFQNKEECFAALDAFMGFVGVTRRT